MGLTLAELAERVGVPWQTLAAYETGRVTPPADRLLILVHATRGIEPPFQLDKVARLVARAAA